MPLKQEIAAGSRTLGDAPPSIGHHVGIVATIGEKPTEIVMSNSRKANMRIVSASARDSAAVCPTVRAFKASLTFLIAISIVTTGRAQPQSESAAKTTNDFPAQQLEIKTERLGVWQSDIGEGFRSTAQDFEVGFGANYGFAVLGGKHSHDLALVSLSYGHMLDSTIGEGRWYRGNFELRGELFSGAEFSPNQEWLVGLSPHLRYDFATGTRWVPFADVGAGVTATGIGAPDLSGTFEFNLQAGGGMHWFIRRNLALTVELHYLHLSCAGLHDPNLGLNGITGTLGATFFF